MGSSPSNAATTAYPNAGYSSQGVPMAYAQNMYPYPGYYGSGPVVANPQRYQEVLQKHKDKMYDQTDDDDDEDDTELDSHRTDHSRHRHHHHHHGANRHPRSESYAHHYHNHNHHRHYSCRYCYPHDHIPQRSPPHGYNRPASARHRVVETQASRPRTETPQVNQSPVPKPQSVPTVSKPSQTSSAPTLPMRPESSLSVKAEQFEYAPPIRTTYIPRDPDDGPIQSYKLGILPIAERTPVQPTKSGKKWYEEGYDQAVTPLKL